MATLAEQLVGSALQSSQQAPDITKSITSGAALAQSVQQVQQNREKIELEKQQHQLMKVDKLTSAMEAGAKMKSKSARNAFFKNYIPSMQQALGLQDFIPADTMKMIEADPEEAKKFSLLKTKIMNGDMTYDQAVAQMDPEAWVVMDDNEVLQLEASEKFRIQQQEMNKRSENPNNRLENQFDVRQYQEVKNDFDTATKDVRGEIVAGQKAMAALESGGPIAASSVRTQLARMSSEKGPLSDTDLQVYGGSQDLFTRMKTFIEKNKSGNLAPETRKEYEDLIGEYMSVAQAKVGAELDRSSQSASGLGLDPERAKKVIAADNYLKPVGGPKFEVLGRKLSKKQLKSMLDKKPSLRDKIPADVLKAAGL